MQLDKLKKNGCHCGERQRRSNLSVKIATLPLVARNDTFATIAIIMDPASDQVAVALQDIPRGTKIEFPSGTIRVSNFIKKGQRFAHRDIKKREFVRQYGYAFGQSQGVRRGELISTANIKNVLPAIDLSSWRPPAATRLEQKYLKSRFMGFWRKDGRVGTRNYYLVIPASMCASEIARQTAASLDDDQALLSRYPSIDGIVAIAHSEGCGCDSGLSIDRLMLVLKNYCLHPNTGGCLFLDLGCEQSNHERLRVFLKGIPAQNLKPIDWLTIQDSGGTAASIEKAKKIIISRLKRVNTVKRRPAPLSKLIAGTECGASDSFSGITANPVIGCAVDKIISGAGAAILSEIPEMLGTESMLLPRFRSLALARKFMGLVSWYEQLARRLGFSLEPNLVPKNIEGGLINNYIKSLGAVMKGGTSVIEDVIDYGQRVKKRGLHIMQGPGNDLESVTGLTACGATVICFSTGKGTVTGEAICPVIKIASTHETFKKLPQDMDFDAGRLLAGKTDIDTLGKELLSKIIAVACGEKTWSERWKQRQFQIWTTGKLSL